MSLPKLQENYLESRYNNFNFRLKNKFFPKALDNMGLVKKKKKIGFAIAMRKKKLVRGKSQLIEGGKKSVFPKIRDFTPSKKNCTTIYIQSTHNNTIFTLSNGKGKTYCCVSTGMCGFKNSRKSTSYASQAAVEKLALLAKNSNTLISQRNSFGGKEHVCIKMRGLGPGKLSGVRAVHQYGFRVVKIEECTFLPHNGCRPPKLRRV